MSKYAKSRRSSANGWFLHRITGTFLIFLLITHFWVQHYDHSTASVAVQVLTSEQIEQGELPDYDDVVMTRLADPVYAVLWKGFNILFLIFALHHGFYGLNNVLTDYIRNDMGRIVARTLSWGLALVLLVIGLYSVITAGWNYPMPGG